MSVKPSEMPEYAALVAEYRAMHPLELMAVLADLHSVRDADAAGAPELPYHQYSELNDRIWVATFVVAERGAVRAHVA